MYFGQKAGNNSNGNDLIGLYKVDTIPGNVHLEKEGNSFTVTDEEIENHLYQDVKEDINSLYVTRHTSRVQTCHALSEIKT